MTITITDRVTVSTGNGATTVWPHSFNIPDADSANVEVTEIATGIITVIAAADYTITGLGTNSGTVTYPKSGTPLASTHTIARFRNVPAKQTTNITNQTKYDAGVVMTVWDRIVMMVQDLTESTTRHLSLPIGDNATVEVPSVINRKNRVLGFDENGDVEVVASVGAVTVSPYMETVLDDMTPTEARATLGVNGIVYDDYADFASSTEVARSVGSIVRYGPHKGIVVTSGGDIQNSAAIPMQLDVLLSAGGVFNPKAFGDIGNGGDDIVVLQAAADASFFSGVGYADVIYPAGIYLISEPLRLTGNHRMDGTNAIIKAMPGYTGVTLDNIGLGGTTLVEALLLFLLGDFNDIGGAQRENAFVGNGLTLDCNEVSDSGIYLERMPYADVNCKVINAAAGGNAIDIGPYCWGTHLNGPTVENFSENAIAIGEGSNGITITSPRIWGKNKTGVTGILVKSVANVNGLAIVGGFIEKLAYGLFVDRGNGPISVSGTDFEVCTTNCIGVYGNVADAFKATVTATGCYFSATGSKIYAEYGIVNISGSRLRSGDDFETGSGAFIDAANNQYESGLPTIVADSNVAVDIELPWTPVLLDDSLSGAEGQTYAHSVGSYNRVGNKIFYQCNMAMSSLGTLGVGEGGRLGGLPRASSSVANSHSAVSVGLGAGLNIAAVNALTGYVGVGVDFITLQKFSAVTGTANLTVGEVTAAGILIVSGWYTV